MPLAPGTVLGPYQLVEFLGSGGMGEVYQARDTRLDRFVALKRLNAEFARRFENEARTIAHLNHPNICAIYDIGPDYFVMEYVEGQPLDRLIQKSGMRLSEALRIASQVADGLARAHATGIIHRDLKPANVIITPAGTAKILDFGLAKAIVSEGTQSHEDRTVTEEGTIVGTPAYMSPEQAEGRPLDTRSDIFSFGTMLYEMVTGRTPFGKSKLSTLAAVVHTDPVIPDNLPRPVVQILQRCLRKDPARRWQSAADLRVALDDARDEVTSGVAGLTSAHKPRSRAPRMGWWAAAALLLAAVASGATWWVAHSSSAELGPTFTRLTWDAGVATDPAISPDGKLVAYASDRAGEGSTDIWVQQVGGGQAIRVTTDPANDLEPSFSPDSSLIAFRSERNGGGIYIVSALGGSEKLVARYGHSPSFSPDGRWLAYRRGEEGETFGKRMVDIVPVSGGSIRELTTPVIGVRAPIWSTDSESIFMRGSSIPTGYLETCVTPIDGREPRCNPDNAESRSGWNPLVWLKDYLYYSQFWGESTDIYRVHITPSGRLRGQPERLTAGTIQSMSAGIRLGPNGRPEMAVATGSSNIDIWGIPMNTNRATQVGSPLRITSSPASDFGVYPFPDGQRIGFMRGISLTSYLLMIRNLQTGVESEFTRNPIPVMSFSPDGGSAAYMRDSKIYLVSPSEPAPVQVSDERGRPDDWTQDGRFILLSPWEASEGAKTHTARLIDVAEHKTTVLTQDPAHFVHPTRFSPDDRWFSIFVTNTAVTRQIFVVPFRPEREVKMNEWVPITDGKSLDREPRWSPDGDTIYFLSDRDGFRCIWAQRLDHDSKKPSGAAFAVFHAHSSRLSMNVATDTAMNGLTVTTGRIYVSMSENTSNIWLARWE